jgi:DNA-binding transcriptional LysR family regulator
VHLELKIKPTVSIIDDVLLNTVDVGFTRPTLEAVMPPTIKAVPVYEDHLMVVLPVDHPLNREPGPIPISRLRNERFVLRPRGTGPGFYEQVFTLCGEAGFAPLIAQEATEATTTLGLVAAGVGITVAPQALQSIRVHDVVWRELAETQTASRILLIYNKGSSNPLRDKFISGFKPIE